MKIMMMQGHRRKWLSDDTSDKVIIECLVRTGDLNEGGTKSYDYEGGTNLQMYFVTTGESRSKDPTCEIGKSRKADLTFL